VDFEAGMVSNCGQYCFRLRLPFNVVDLRNPFPRLLFPLSVIASSRPFSCFMIVGLTLGPSCLLVLLFSRKALIAFGESSPVLASSALILSSVFNLSSLGRFTGSDTGSEAPPAAGNPTTYMSTALWDKKSTHHQ
jgi:hypothetical protein